jgi:aspartyl-tRNA(Asn)/glutamyl-tRNA(Gln) amidotransferase subunit B
MKYDVVIGLEIHAELATASKVFCSCEQYFGGEANSRCCAGCAAYPGTLPVLNKQAIAYAIKAGLALDCSISLINAFDRKNYFYPDLPKSYQISQLYKPICLNGKVTLSDGCVVRINRIHLEEDAGKLIHDDYNGVSLADYNRGSVPLIEIVTEPDISNGEQAREFVEIIASRLRYAEVCKARMEEGSLRCDVNISLKPQGSPVLGTRVEIKNLNSLKSIVRAVEYETERQSEMLEKGKTLVQETRRFNENHGRTISMRNKEEAQDYRYFPDPDIPVLKIEQEEVDEIRKSLPEMPQARLERYVRDYSISEASARIIITSKYYSDFYDMAVQAYNNPAELANLFVVELFRLINDHQHEGDFKFSAAAFARLAQMVDQNLITRAAQKKILEIMFIKGGEPDKIAKEENLILENDTEALDKAVAQVLAECEKAVQDYKGGNPKVFGFLMGQVTRIVGKATSPALIKEKLLKELE